MTCGSCQSQQLSQKVQLRSNLRPRSLHSLALGRFQALGIIVQRLPRRRRRRRWLPQWAGARDEEPASEAGLTAAAENQRREGLF